MSCPTSGFLKDSNLNLLSSTLTEAEALHAYLSVIAPEYDIDSIVEGIVRSYPSPMDIFYYDHESSPFPIFEDKELLHNIASMKGYSALYHMYCKFRSYTYIDNEYIASIVAARFSSIISEQVWYFGMFDDGAITPLRYVSAGDFGQVMFGKKKPDENEDKPYHKFLTPFEQKMGVNTDLPIYECEGIIAELMGEIPLDPEDSDLGFFEMVEHEAKQQATLGRILTSVVVIHNHPRGTCLPSEEDDLATEELIPALAKNNPGIVLREHIVVGDDGLYFVYDHDYFPREGHSIRNKDRKRLKKRMDSFEKSENASKSLMNNMY